MTVSTISSRDLNQDVGSAKRASLEGPVVITDRGKPTHVLLSYPHYRALVGDQGSIVDALSMKGLSDAAFDPPRLSLGLSPADLS